MLRGIDIENLLNEARKPDAVGLPDSNTLEKMFEELQQFNKYRKKYRNFREGEAKGAKGDPAVGRFIQDKAKFESWKGPPGGVKSKNSKKSQNLPPKICPSNQRKRKK